MSGGDAPLTATVVPDVTGLDKSFDYLVPTQLRSTVRVGTSVRVPLHGRRVGGWVVRVGPPTGDVAVEHEDNAYMGDKWNEGLTIAYNTLRPLVAAY